MNKIKITSIMPTYNVEKYIYDAIDSLIDQIQSNIELEIIIVDDGSTDMTKSIVKEYQQKYPFISLIEKNGIGPGEARNIAMKKATGDYIAFIDGDDMLYPKAYEKLLNSALQNDADIVVGNVSRFDSTRTFFLSGLHKKIFSDEMIGTNILEYSALLFDTTSWNKLFKTSFLTENNINFPEGILYEDIPFNMEAHLKSKGTNIINDYVYKWQLRNDGDKSITQSRHDTKNMLDRITAMKKFNDIIEDLEIDNQEFIEQKELKELDIDLKLFLDQLIHTDEDYFELFSRSVSNYVVNMKTDVFNTKLVAITRIRYQLVMENKKEDLAFFNKHTKEFYAIKNVVKDDKVIKIVEGTVFQNFGNASFFDVTSDVTPITKVKRVYWTENQLNIEGMAFLRYLDADSKVSMTAVIDNASSKVSFPIPIEVVKDKSHTQIHGGGKQQHLIKRTYNYDYSGYRIVIDFNNNDIQKLLEDDCFIKVSISNKGFDKEFYLSQPVKGFKVRPKDFSMDNKVYKISYNKKWILKMSSTEIGGKIKDIIVQDNQLTISGELIANDVSHITLVNHPLNYSVQPQMSKFEEKEFIVTFNLNDLERIPDGENFYIKFSSEGSEYKVEIENESPVSFVNYGSKEICFNTTRNNLLQIYIIDDVQPKISEIDFYSINKKNVEFKFDIYQDLRNYDISNVTNFLLEGTRNSDGLVFQIEPKKIEIENSVAKLNYHVKMTSKHLEKFGNSSWKFSLLFKVGNNFNKKMLISEFVNSKINWSILKNNFTISKNNKHEIELYSSLQKDYFEKGPRRKKMLLDYVYPLWTKLPLKKKTIMFEAYWGKSYSCNPKALHQYIERNYPEYTTVWGLNNPYDNIEGNAIKVRRNSWRYFYYLARSKYLVNNVNWPNDYIKRDSSIEIQTLHGTFLKTMGLDVADEVKTPQQLEGFRKRHGRWNYLVSPSSFMTDISKRVFEFNKDMLEFGFPRNDILVNAKENIDLSVELKNKLNIPQDKKVILYAPTYRNKSGFNLELDIRQMEEQLSDEYVLLVRLHYFVAKSLDLSGVEDFVYNVCNFPDVQELLLITDVLITDYSSIMFDFANLNRPMMFFTYDLEYYRDVLRGMYLDFEQEAPGKLSKKTEELIVSLKDLENYERAYSEKLSKFRLKFNEYETGEASKKIFDRLL